MARRVPRTASGALRLTISVISSARVRSWSCSTTSVMSPSSRARSAESRSCLPSRAMRMAALIGMVRATRTISRPGHEPDAHVRIEELRPVGGDRDVAGGDEVEAGAAADPVDRDDDRLGHGTERRRGFLGRLPFPEVREVPPLVRHLAVVAHAFDVGAGAERPTGGGDQDRPHVVVGFGARVGVAQLALHLQAHRVEHVGPVERDRRGAVGDLVEDRLVGHRTTYPPSTMSLLAGDVAASSLARNRIASAMSSTAPDALHRHGARRTRRSAPPAPPASSPCTLAGGHRRAHEAGRHALTRTPWRASSAPTWRV